MKTKLVLWGTNAQEERILIALELLPEENFVNIFTFPENVATEEFSQKMLDVWRDGGEVEFPEGFTTEKRELSMSEGLLPEGLKAERADIVQRAQTEWHFMVLSTKLNESYKTELNSLREKIDGMQRYESSMWEKLKSFWDKVQVQVRDRNLLKDHANALRDNTNELFSKLKGLRAKLDEEFNQLSKSNHDKFLDILANVEKKVSDGLRLQPIFEELKDIQRKFRDAKLTRDHRSKVWEKLDASFKMVKEKRFGAGANEDRSPLERLHRRYDGLLAAIEKMQRSIQRDEDDLVFQNKKIANSDGQLEAQIRQAKIKMIQERINSKEEKLGEMRTTQKELEERIEKQKEKDAKRKEQEKLEEARKQAEAEIAKRIKEAANARKDEEKKLEKAAESIRETSAPKSPEADSNEENTAEPEANTEVEAKPEPEVVEQAEVEKQETPETEVTAEAPAVETPEPEVETPEVETPPAETPEPEVETPAKETEEPTAEATETSTESETPANTEEEATEPQETPAEGEESNDAVENESSEENKD